jgi:hypothetical protein
MELSHKVYVQIFYKTLRRRQCTMNYIGEYGNGAELVGCVWLLCSSGNEIGGVINMRNIF